MKIGRTLIAIFIILTVLWGSTITQSTGWIDNGSTVTALSGRNVVVGNPLPAGAPAGSMSANCVYSASVGYDVRCFGAVGNGTTDDYAAFHAACAAVPSGGKIVIPAGTYKLDLTGATPAAPKNACLITADNVSVVGQGRASRLNMIGWTVADGMANPDAGAGLQVATAIAFGDATHTVTGGLIRDVYITGAWNGTDAFSGVLYSRAKGVGLYNAHGVTVDNVETASIPGNGINWSGNIGVVYDVRVTNAKIDLSAEGGINFMGGTHRGSITNSRISNSAGAGIEAACADCVYGGNLIWSSGSVGLDISGNRAIASNNNIWLSTTHGIYIDPQAAGCNDVALSNNLSHENGSAGIAVGVACLRASIQGGSAKNNGIYGVTLFGVNDGTRIVNVDASDDQITPTQQNGITVASSAAVIVQGNRLFGNVAQSIYFASGTIPIITGNVADRAVNLDVAVTGEVVANNIP